MINRREIGAWGENMAAQWLRTQGYTIVAQNYHTRWGEIDIVARGTHWLSFIEVKLRTRDNGSAERSVNYRKQQHWQQAARVFCWRESVANDCAIIFEQVSLYVNRVTKVVRCCKYVVS